MAASMTAGLSRPEIAVKHARIMKSLEKMGVELIAVEDKTGNRIEKAASAASQAAGSLLVTSEMAPGLIMLLEQYGKFRAHAQHVPMGAGSTLTPKIDSLLTMYVPGEGVAPTVSDPTVGAVNLIAKALTGLFAYSMELDEDSAVAMGELYGDLAARSAAYYEDLCGFLGDGSSTYFGFRGIAGAMRAVDATIANIKSVVVGSGNAYSEFVYSDFEKMAGLLPDYADNERTRMLMHKYFYYTVFVRAALAAGTGHAQEVILGSAQRQKLAMGYPVEFVQVMPKSEANSQHCATLGDLSLGCQFGTRGVMEFAQSEHRYFDQGLIAARVRERIAINAHGVGDTTKEGPMIALYTAAS
jgi:HK97 family phage major capsid protein